MGQGAELGCILGPFDVQHRPVSGVKTKLVLEAGEGAPFQYCLSFEVAGKPFEGVRDANGAEVLSFYLERQFRRVVPPNRKLRGRFVTDERIANIWGCTNEFTFYFRPSMYRALVHTKLLAHN